MPRTRSSLAFLAQWGKVKPIFALLLLALPTLVPVGTSWATEIDGKWGLGVAVGNFVSSRAEASLLRGTSDKTAWLFDVAVNGSKDNRDVTNRYPPPPSDTTITYVFNFEGFTINLGLSTQEGILEDGSAWNGATQGGGAFGSH